MKKALILLAFVFTGAILLQCSDESQDNNLGASQVSFKIDVVSGGVSNPVPIGNLASVKIILERPNKSVALQKEIQVTRENNLITTEPVELTKGEYRIREFSARDAQGNIVYQLQINHPTSCEGDKNLLKTFYAGGSQQKTIALVLRAVSTGHIGS